MGNKLHFLLSTPGVASITAQRRSVLCPMAGKLSLPGEMSPEARPHPPARLTYTPGGCQSQESHGSTRCLLCLCLILSIMTQGKDMSEVNLEYFFVACDISQAMACSLPPTVPPIFCPSAHCMCVSAPQIHSDSCLDWLVNDTPGIKNPKISAKTSFFKVTVFMLDFQKRGDFKKEIE